MNELALSLISSVALGALQDLLRVLGITLAFGSNQSL